jgi:hypothetical protein
MRSDKYFEPHFLFSKAEAKLKNDLDVVSIVKTMRKFKAVTNAILS